MYWWRRDYARRRGLFQRRLRALGGESRVGKGKKKSTDDMIKRWETAAKNLDGVKLNIPEESGEYGVCTYV
jgi:hypothetical protein